MTNDAKGLSRRAALGSIAAAAAAPVVAKPAAGERPNILWIVSEDNNPYIHCYGDKLAHTPTIDGLARKGLLYRNVYSNAPVCAPSRFGILTGVYPESCAPANQMRAIARFPKEFRTYPELMREAGYFCTNNSKTDYNCDVVPDKIWNVQGAEGHWRKRPKNKPFLAVFNYEISHESQLFKVTPGRVTPDMITVPPFLPDTPGIRQDYASYYNLIEKMDTQLGERLAELATDGLADDTIVFHYSDNGGVLPRSKRYCFDEGLRCEMVVYVPPKWQHLMPQPAGTEVKEPVSFIDLAPTLLSLAGAPKPPQMRGRAFLGARREPNSGLVFGMRNRMDERIDFSRTVTDGRWRYTRNYMPHRPWGVHQAFEWLAKGYQDWEAAHRAGTLNAVQDRFFGKKPYEELYDLKKDPFSLHNLIGTKQGAAMERRLSAALDSQMIAINDNGFLPETMPGEGYVESRNRTLYPLTEVMKLGATAARGKPAGIPALLAALKSEAPVMRYWGMTGLLILGKKAGTAFDTVQAVMDHDPDPMVRIVAAETFAGLGGTGAAVRTLAALADPKQPWQVQLHALNSLTFLGPDVARPAIETVRAASENEEEYVRNAGRYLLAVLEGRYTPAYPVFDLARMFAKMKAGA